MLGKRFALHHPPVPAEAGGPPLAGALLPAMCALLDHPTEASQTLHPPLASRRVVPVALVGQVHVLVEGLPRFEVLDFGPEFGDLGLQSIQAVGPCDSASSRLAPRFGGRADRLVADHPVRSRSCGRRSCRRRLGSRSGRRATLEKLSDRLDVVLDIRLKRRDRVTQLRLGHKAVAVACFLQCDNGDDQGEDAHDGEDEEPEPAPRAAGHCRPRRPDRRGRGRHGRRSRRDRRGGGRSRRRPGGGALVGEVDVERRIRERLDVGAVERRLGRRRVGYACERDVRPVPAVGSTVVDVGDLGKVDPIPDGVLDTCDGQAILHTLHVELGQVLLGRCGGHFFSFLSCPGVPELPGLPRSDLQFPGVA